MDFTIIFILEILLIFSTKPAPVDIYYPVSTIPEELKQGSDAVIREDIRSFEIYSLNSSKYYHKLIVTVFNENADDFNWLSVPYDKNSRITRFEGKIYDATGNIDDKLKQSEIIDLSAVDGISLYADDRQKYARMVAATYPYTIEFEYEITYNNLYFSPNWMPVMDEKIAIENSTMTIKTPLEFKIRYLEKNLPEPGKVNETDNNVVYSWKLSNMKSITKEAFMPPEQDILPVVLTGPVHFEWDGYSGNMSTWKDYGAWIYKLNQGRDSLPDETIIKVRNLVSGINNKREQVKKIYEYLQNNTRYISVQLGIGGLQTYDAVYVDKNGYGDCKALSNYMHSLLKAVNISSFATLVRAGKNQPDIQIDFPSGRFNHAILCVPVEKDTIWLECTSQNNPFGYMSTFTGNRHVLIITEKGGVISKTPTYTKEMNTQFRKGEVDIHPDGTATAKITTTSAGLQYDQVKPFIHADLESQKKGLYNQISIPDFDLVDFSFSEEKNMIPDATENLNLSMKRFLTVSGKRLFFQPNIMNQNNYTSLVKETRVYDIEFDFPFIDIDSIIFNFPSEYHLEFPPKATDLNSAFGSYSSSVVADQGKIIYIRKLERNSGRFPKENYAEFKDFILKVISADKMKLVLVKTT